MFEINNNLQLLHKDAVSFIIDNLPGAVSMDSLVGMGTPYDIEWNNLKIMVKVARLSMKRSLGYYRWYFAVNKQDRELADFIILVTLNKDKIDCVYAIPKVFLPRTYITVSRLEGNNRYEMFIVDVKDLPSKIMELKEKLPKLYRMKRSAVNA
jgi:hypothetical protein